MKEKIYPNYRDFYKLSGAAIIITRSCFGAVPVRVNKLYFDSEKEALEYFEVI